MIRECFLIIVIRIPQGERWNQTEASLFAECPGMLDSGRGYRGFAGYQKPSQPGMAAA